MKRRWNWFLPAGFVVTLVAFFSYFLLFAQFPVTRDFPWMNLLLFAGGLGLLGIGLRRAFRQSDRYRGTIAGPLFTVVSLLVVGLFLFYAFFFSRQLPASADVPRVGQQAPDFALPDTHGNLVSLSDLLPGSEGDAASDRWLLLVFYRGYW